MTDLRDEIETTRSTGLIVADLLLDLSRATGLLVDLLRPDRLDDPDMLDAFLLAAGVVQILEDHIERDTLTLRRAASCLDGGVRARAATSALRGAATAAEAGRAWLPAGRRALAWRNTLRDVRDGLATAVVGGGYPPWRHTEALAATGRLRDALPAAPTRPTADVLRLPTCFRSFDQRPEDMVALAGKYARTLTDAHRPVLVLGIRTSGGYLAPLVAAALRQSGMPDVTVRTMRPDRAPHPADRADLRALLRRGPAVAVVDDPPVSGSSVRAGVEFVRRHGAAADSVTLLLPLFGIHAPESLAGHPQVTLPFDQWAVHRQLSSGAVASALSAMLGVAVTAAQPVTAAADIPPVGPPQSGDRGHVRAVFQIHTADGRTRELLVAGAGLGYLGRHALAVAGALDRHLPRTYGFADGLVYRDWLPEDARVRHADPADVPGFVAYIRDRATAMPASADASRGLAGRAPAWEIASRIVASGFGQAGMPLRTGLIDPAMRRLCAPARPSVVDGATSLTHWFREGASLRKVDAEVHDFSNGDRYCYDAVFDLAGIDPGSASTDFVRSLRAAYPCPDERFLLYQWVHLADRLGADPAARQAAARAGRRYAAAVFPAAAPRAPAAPGGPLCALDIDGVLESGSMGFPVITPAAMVAMRALSCHGYRPVVVTGRSLAEVRERCETYGLAGGVAEYGALAYRHHSGVDPAMPTPAVPDLVTDLVTDDDRRLLTTLRDTLRRIPGVAVVEGYRRVVRAQWITGGRLAPLPTPMVLKALTGLGDQRHRVSVIPGQAQTDFAPTATDKGHGLAALADLLAEDDGARPPVALAVGDTDADLPMLAMARHAYAPGNATAAVRTRPGVRVLRARYAAGLAEAVHGELGHRPGGCLACRPPRHDADTRLLLAMLAAQEAGASGIPRAVLRAAVELLRSRR